MQEVDRLRDVASRPRVAARTLGCKVNQVDTEKVLVGLISEGFDVGDEASADVILVNTCTVTAEADAKARKAIRHALTCNPTATVVVSGCLAALEPDEVASLGERVVVESDRSRVRERLAGLVGVPRTRRPAPVRAGTGFHTRAMVKIEDGCDAFCAYCVVPYARGAPRSVPADEVIAECASLVEAGVKEVVLTGVNLGRYEHSGLDLGGLVSRVADTGVARLRLSSIEPLDLTAGLLDTFASTPALCEHLHVPLQSGDDKVLEEMGRGYTSAQYADRVAAARSAIPGLRLSTDVLVGFPGESEEQADTTLEFCRELAFDRLHVFRYSARSRTRAASRDDHVAAALRVQRAERMRDLDRDLRSARAGAAAGSEREMLVERIRTDTATGAHVAEGTTRDYFRVRLPLGAAVSDVAPGARVDVILGGVEEDGVIAVAPAAGTNQGQGTCDRTPSVGSTS